jgi:hypothetical protein
MFEGMPQALMLNEFGSQVWSVFGSPPYLVGSSLKTKQWRDIDVRLILSDEDYEKWGFGAPTEAHINSKWVALCLAFSALGKSMTGLPVDFQIQQSSFAHSKFPSPEHPRSALGIIGLRFKHE